MTNSLPFFPVPRAGETVFSVVGRCLGRLGIADKHLLFLLTGQHRRATLLGALPGHLRLLVQAMPVGHPWKDIQGLIEHNTSLPYYSYFDSTTYRADFINRLANTDVSYKVSLALGLTQYRCASSPKHPRFCIRCAEEDAARWGYSCFYREHQLPGVALCFEHGTELAHGCHNCGPYPLLRKPFNMPARCLCANFSALEAFQSLPNSYDNLAWIARESAYIVSSPAGSPHFASRQPLEQCLILNGLSRGSHLSYSAIASALDERYSAGLLNWLGYPARKDGRPSAWIRRLFDHAGTQPRRRPTITLLLVLGLLYESVKAFELANAYDTDQHAARPSDSELLSASDSDVSSHGQKGSAWKGKLRSNLQANNFRISTAAVVAGVSSYAIAVEAREQGIRIPLSAAAIKRIGCKQLEDIRIELRAGTQKKIIQEAHLISEWSLFLVELDDLELNSAHRMAASLGFLESHRDSVRDYVERNPKATRSSVMKAIAGSYHYLISNDKQWFQKLIPAVRRHSSGKRPSKTNWAAWDKWLAVKIRAHVAKIQVTDDKPQRITATGLLNAMKATSKYAACTCSLPETKATLNEVTETKALFLERKILWGIRKMARENKAISVNVLRRVIGTSPSRLRERKQFVIEAMKRLGAVAANRSFFD